MPSAGRHPILTVVLLVLAATAAGDGAVIDAVLEPPATGPQPPVLSVSLAGQPVEVTAVSPPVRPGVVAAVIDLNGLDPAQRVRASEIVGALASGAPAVLVAEVSDGLAIRLTPSPRSTALGEALEAALQAEGPPGPRGGPREAVLAAIAELAAVGGTAVATVEVEGLRRRAEAHAASSRLAALRRVAAYDQLVRTLAVLPGRKTVLLVASELEIVPGGIVAGAWREAFPEMPSRTLETLAASRDLESALIRLGDRAAAHRVAFYPLPSVGEGGRLLAAASGGRTVDPHRLEVAAEPAHEVGFLLREGLGPDPAELGVSRADGGSARAVPRWVPLDPAEVAADRTLGAAGLGLADNPLEIAAAAQPARDQGNGTAMVPILVTVPVARLQLRQEDSRHLARVLVLTAVAGEAGVGRREFPVEVPPGSLEQALASRAGFVVGVTLSPGRHLLAVGVCDRHSGSSATTLVPVAVAAGEGNP